MRKTEITYCETQYANREFQITSIEIQLFPQYQTTIRSSIFSYAELKVGFAELKVHLSPLLEGTLRGIMNSLLSLDIPDL